MPTPEAADGSSNAYAGSSAGACASRTAMSVRRFRSSSPGEEQRPPKKARDQSPDSIPVFSSIPVNQLLTNGSRQIWLGDAPTKFLEHLPVLRHYSRDVPFLTPSDNPGHRPVAARTTEDIIQQHTYRLVAQNSTNTDLEYPSPSKVHMTKAFYDSASLHTGFIECIAPHSLVPQPVPGSDIISIHDSRHADPIYKVSSRWRDNVIGQGSKYHQSLRRARLFAQMLTESGILAHGLPGYFDAMAVVNGLRNSFDTTARLGIVGSLEYHITTAREVERVILLADAVLRLCFFIAYDAAAVLGGVQLPIWPIHHTLTGIIFDLSQEDALLLPTRATIRQLERWGIPHWSIQVSNRSRYALSPDERPHRTEAIESMRQITLSDLAGRHHVRQVYIPLERHSTITSPGPIMQSPLFTHDPETHFRTCTKFLVASESNPYSFREFTKSVRFYLSDVWRTFLYEAESREHCVSPGSQWHTMREAFTIGHSRVLLQAFSFVPSLYLHPDQTLNEAQSGSQPGPSTKASLNRIAVTPSNTWYRVVFQPLDEEANAQNQLVSQFETNGLLGWRKRAIREYKPLKKQCGFEFLFKTARERDQTALLLQNKLPGISLRTEDADAVKNVATEFCSWVDLDFINQLYASPFDDTLRHQITLVAPSAWLPATSNETTPQKVERLVKAELLEVGKFPVIIGQEDNKVELPVMDLYWLTEGYLTLIIRQYRTCNILREDDKPHLCRFLVMLKVLSSKMGKNSFKQNVHDTSNGMYSRIIRHIAQCIEEDRTRDTGALLCGVIPRESRMNMSGSPSFEWVGWSGKVGRYNICVSLSSPKPLVRPTQPILNTESERKIKMKTR